MFSERDKRDIVNATEIICYRLLTMLQSIEMESSRCTFNTCSNYKLL